MFEILFRKNCNACQKYLNHMMCSVTLKNVALHTILFNFTMWLWNCRRRLFSYKNFVGWKATEEKRVPDRLEIIKNQQLINLYRTTLLRTWFCLHVSQNKLSAGTPLCDINFISAIKRKMRARSGTNRRNFSQSFTYREREKGSAKKENIFTGNL